MVADLKTVKDSMNYLKATSDIALKANRSVVAYLRG